MLDLAGIIRPGDGVLWGQACAEPRALVHAFLEQRAAYSGARVFMGLSYSALVQSKHADHLRLSSYCGTGSNRALADDGVLEIMPAPYSRLGDLLREGRIPCDVVLVQASPPNARGEYSLGLAAEYLVPALAKARAIIAEINDQVPWTQTERLLRKDDLALVIESSAPPVELPSSPPTDSEKKIAAHAAQYIPHGAVVECGIGTLPNAVLGALRDRRGLSIHSGAIGDGVADLDLGACAAGTLIGTRRLFDWARDNAKLRLYSSDHTHGAKVLGGLERFVAINSAVEVDLTGQVNGEVARGSYVGAVGGALDFVRAANSSPGGISLTVIPGSRIVERLSGPVSIPRGEAGVIVTEKGAADLRGCTLREREKRLAAISGTP